MFNPVPSNLVRRLTDAIFCLAHTTSYNTRNNTINTIPPRNGYSMICTAFKPLWLCCFGISSVQIQLQLPSHLSGLTVLRIPAVNYLQFLCDAIPSRLLWYLRSLRDLYCTLRLQLYILLSGHNEGQSWFSGLCRNGLTLPFQLDWLVFVPNFLFQRDLRVDGR